MKTFFLKTTLPVLAGFTVSLAQAGLVLHDFAGGISDGGAPYGSVTVAGSKLYGMTTVGGGLANGGGGLGTIYTLNTDGTGYTLLHSFNGTASDGGAADGSLTLVGSKLYGMTRAGGGSSNGTIFSMNTDGTGFGLLHSFNGGPADARTPFGSLTVGGATLYGMSGFGGSNGGGAIFAINTDGTGYSLLHQFPASGIPGFPNTYGSLTLSGSFLYGGTIGGGSNGTFGTIFTVRTDGSGYNVLHQFTGGANDGKYSVGSLTLVGSKIYGMTESGGGTDNGTIFSMNTDGTEFGLLHSFTGGATGGQQPESSLTLVGSTFYGTTFGSTDATGTGGTVFSLNTDGTNFTVLESFTGPNGKNPYGELTVSADAATLYGTTTLGGSAGSGTVFSFGVSSIPEPSTIALVGVSVLAVATARRRRRNIFI